MISSVYTYGYDTQEKNGKIYHHSPRKVFGNEPWEIEISEPDMTFEEMINDPELFIPHHLLEILYSKKDLEKLNRYDNVKPDELIWMRESTHFRKQYNTQITFTKRRSPKTSCQILER